MSFQPWYKIVGYVCVCVCVCSRLEGGELTGLVIHVTQLCCMPFAFDTSDVLLVNIQRCSVCLCLISSVQFDTKVVRRWWEVMFPPASVDIYIGMFVNNFLGPIQVWLSPNLVSFTLGHRERGDYILEGQSLKGQGRWGGVCALLKTLLVQCEILHCWLSGTSNSEN